MSKKNVRLRETQEVILKTINLIADAVTDTMGPGGKSVALPSMSGGPIITKDGVTVANAIELENEEENLICTIIKQAADRTNKQAGDGTTTSIALTRAIFSEGHKYVKAGNNVTQIKREIDAGKRKVLKRLKLLTRAINDKDKNLLYKNLLDIATISMNGEVEIAELVAKAITDAGKYGIVNVIENSEDSNELEKVEGVKLNQGWVSPFFVKERGDRRIVLEDCRILITSHQFKNSSQLQDIEEALKPLIKEAKPLLIISSECSGEFLSNIVANNKQGRLVNCAIRPPYFGNIRKEFYTDLGYLTGATVIEAEEGHALERIKFEHLGYAKRVEITDTTTTIIGGAGNPEEIKERVTSLKSEVEEIGFKDLNKVEERLAKLAGGVVLIKLARQSHVEMEERRHRIEDAVNACKAALEEGIVPGGGAALVKSSEILDEEILGERILKKACAAPMKIIAENSGFSGDVAVYMASNETNDSQTINALSRKRVDAYESGIIDPVKVTVHALANAVSVAGTLLTTNVIISDIPIEVPANPYGVY